MAKSQPLNWAWDCIGGPKQKAAVQSVTANSISYVVGGHFLQAQYRGRLGLLQAVGGWNAKARSQYSGEAGRST